MQAHAPASRPGHGAESSRRGYILNTYTAAHCIIRPILLFRKWEDNSRAILGVNMWWECIEFSPHHFRAAQAHALATRPGHGAESPRLVYTAAHCIIRPILLFRNWEEVSRAIFGVHMWWECVSTPSSTAGDTCIFQSCPRLFRGHVHTLGAWAPEFGLYAHRPQTCVIVRSDRSAGCHCRARRTPMFETWVTGSRELAMPSRRAASTRHF